MFKVPTIVNIRGDAEKRQLTVESDFRRIIKVATSKKIVIIKYAIKIGSIAFTTKTTNKREIKLHGKDVIRIENNFD